MSYSNRELSQFASFLKVNDTNQKIAITTTATPFVGIGSTNPTEKLDVFGNIKASGIVSAMAFYGDGSTLNNVTAVVNGYFVSEPAGIWTGKSVGIGTSTFDHRLNVEGNVFASRFISYVPQGTPPFQVFSNTLVPNLNAALFQGRTPPDGNIVGTGDTQTLSNKTLISPIISSISNGSATLTLPTTGGTLLHSGGVGIITSGLYQEGSISNIHINIGAAVSYNKLNLTNSINNSDINVGAAISYNKLNLFNNIKSSDIDPNNKIQNSKLQNSTISGISLGSNLQPLTPGNYLTGDNYTGVGIVTFNVNAKVESISGSIVARDQDKSIFIDSINLDTTGVGKGDIGSSGGNDGVFAIYNTTNSGNIVLSLKNSLGINKNIFKTSYDGVLLDKASFQITTDGNDYSYINAVSGLPSNDVSNKLTFLIDSKSPGFNGDIFCNGGSDGVWWIHNTSSAAGREIGFRLANEALTDYDMMFQIYRNSSNGSRNVSCPRAGTIFSVNGTKNFKIEHPIDENKILSHVSIEGPRADLIYRGIAKLNKGRVEVNLDNEYNLIPGTWKALCRNPQVWITSIDGWTVCKGHVIDEMLVIQSKSIECNENVNWLIIAERQDKAMYNEGNDENGRPILEEDKS
jgi:hypothetical protein